MLSRYAAGIIEASLLMIAGIHNEPGLERREVTAAAVLFDSERHFSR